MIRVVPVAFALLLSCPAAAGEIHVTGGACSGAARLSARDAKLSDVLKELGQVLGFQVSFRADHDPVLNIDATGTPEHLVASIVRGENTSRTHVRDAHCGDRVRLVEVWVLPGRMDEPIGAQASTSPAPGASGLTVARYDGNYLLLTAKETPRNGADNGSAATTVRR